MEKYGQIFIYLSSGLSLIPFNPQMYLDELKDYIEKKDNLTRGQYFLKFNGKAMYENLKLKDYSVQRDSNIYVNIRPTAFQCIEAFP